MKRITATDLLARANAHAAKIGTRAGRSSGPGYDWSYGHLEAWRNPNASREEPIVRMLQALAGYADTHYARFDTTIGMDYVLGEGWASMAKGARVLLNGDLGRLDAGTLDKMLSDMMAGNNVNPETGDVGFEPTEDAT